MTLRYSGYMTTEFPSTDPEKKEAVDDNALKFTVDGLSPEFLQENDAKAFLLTTDWLEMDKRSEKKLAYKKFADGKVDILLIQKFTDEHGNRTVPPKEKLTHDQYDQLLGQSVRRVEKMRHEFDYTQNGTVFSMKYDEFTGSELRVLEVDAQDEAARNSFVPDEFPYRLTNVTGDTRYYGYRVADVLH